MSTTLALRLTEDEARTAAARWLAAQSALARSLEGVQLGELSVVWMPFWQIRATCEGRWTAKAHERRGCVSIVALFSLISDDPADMLRRDVNPQGTLDARPMRATLPATTRLPFPLVTPLGPFDDTPAQEAAHSELPQDIAAETAVQAARGRWQEACEQEIREQIAAPARTVEDVSPHLTFSVEPPDLVWVPVYTTTYRARWQTWQIAIDGSAGTVTGTRPARWLRIATGALGSLLWFALVAACAGLCASPTGPASVAVFFFVLALVAWRAPLGEKIREARRIEGA